MAGFPFYNFHSGEWGYILSGRRWLDIKFHFAPAHLNPPVTLDARDSAFNKSPFISLIAIILVQFSRNRGRFKKKEEERRWKMNEKSSLDLPSIPLRKPNRTNSISMENRFT